MFVVTIVSQGLLECKRAGSKAGTALGPSVPGVGEEGFLSLPASGVRESQYLIGP